MPGALSPIVVLGVGNLLRQDEGVGVHAVRAFESESCGDSVVLVDGGTAVFQALSPWSQIGKLVVIDALCAGRAPGTISRVSLREVADRTAPALSVHEQGLLDALSLLEQGGLRIGEIIIYGVEPGETGWGTDLSPPVVESLPWLAAMLEDELSLARFQESQL